MTRAGMPEDEPNPRDMGFFLALGQVGFEMVLPIAGGILIDVWLEWGPWATIVGAALGLGGGLTHLVLLLNRHDKDKDPSSKRDD